MAKRLAKDIQTTKASIRALTALIGSFLGSLDRTQAASVDRPIIIATGNSYAKPQLSRCGFMLEIQHQARLPTCGRRQVSGTTEKARRRQRTARIGELPRAVFGGSRAVCVFIRLCRGTAKNSHN